MIRPERGVKVSLEEVYEDLVIELNILDIQVEAFTADAPKRADLRQITRFNGKHGKKLRIAGLTVTFDMATNN